MTTAKDLAHVIQSIHFQVANRDWFGIDNRIEALDLDDMDRMLILAWIRSTYAFREKLESWDALVARVTDHFGDDHKHLLHGII